MRWKSARGGRFPCWNTANGSSGEAAASPRSGSPGFLFEFPHSWSSNSTCMTGRGCGGCHTDGEFGKEFEGLADGPGLFRGTTRAPRKPGMPGLGLQQLDAADLFRPKAEAGLATAGAQLLVDADAAVAVEADEPPLDGAATDLAHTHAQVAVQLRVALQARQGEALAAIQARPCRLGRPLHVGLSDIGGGLD